MKFNRDNITIVSRMLAYKSCVEDYTLSYAVTVVVLLFHTMGDCVTLPYPRMHIL